MRGKAFNNDVGSMQPLNLIVAVDECGGFGKNGKIPWHYTEDLKHFQKVTKGAACIMGRLTYQDMYDMIVARKEKNKKTKKPIQFKEILPGRDSYVVTRHKELMGVTTVNNIRRAVESTKKDRIFVIGGERMYTEALPFVNKIYLTLVKGDYNCDKFFPIDYVRKNFKITGGEKGSDNLLFIEYERVKG